MTVTFGGKTAKIENIIVTPKPLSTAGVGWDTAGSPFAYDGTKKSVEMTGDIPAELEAVVSGQTGTNVGDYTAKAEFKLKSGLKAGNYDLSAVEAKTAAWKISPAALRAQNVSRSAAGR